MAGLTSIMAPRRSQIGHLKTPHRQDGHHVTAVSFIRNDRDVAAVFLAMDGSAAGARGAGFPPSHSTMEA